MAQTPLTQIVNSKVIVRVGFDIPNLQDISRIQDAIPTLVQLLKQNNHLILVTKWGKVESFDESWSTLRLLPVLEYELEKALLQADTNFDPNDLAVNYENQFELFENTDGSPISPVKYQVTLLENAHFEPTEKSKDPIQRLELAKKYVTAFELDYLIDECFISSHRHEATNTEIKELLHYSLGLAYQNEVDNLSKIRDSPEAPFVVIMGGAKLGTKLELLKKLLPKADKILTGGLLCFTLLEAKFQIMLDQDLEEIDVPSIYHTPIERDFRAEARALISEFGDKIVLPIDIVYEEFEGQTLGRDIGPKTIELYKQILSTSKTVFWNGPLGFFEKPPFDKATHEIAHYLGELSTSYRVLGGGDTNAALGQELLAKYDFVSMAGGAALDFLAK